jgi:hypothetical protein
LSLAARLEPGEARFEVGGKRWVPKGGKRWVPNCFLGRVVPLRAVKVVPECVSGPRRWPPLDRSGAGDQVRVTGCG